MTQAPGYQGTQSSRILKRGTLEYFVFKFFYDKDETQPVMPLDAQQFPNYRIIAPNGEILHQGVAIPAGSPGHWKIGYNVSKTAALTTDTKRYKFQTVMLDSNMRQFETSFEFDVVESAIPAQIPELPQLITFPGEPLRITFQNTVRPELLRVKVVRRGMDTEILHAATLPTTPPPTPGPNDLIEVELGNHYAYYTEIPALPTVGEYSAIWTVRDSATSPQDLEHQCIEVISSSTMHLVKSLRMLIDKLQKKLGIVYAYTNEDFIEYLKEGTSLVNGYSPPTGYGLHNIPAPMSAFVVLGAAWWGLNAQRLLYAETNLDFSGQTTTLGYNPGADLDGIISSFKEMLDAELKNTKQNLFRQASGVGSIATRPNRYRSGIVFKQHTYTGATNTLVFSHLANYGIILD